MDPASSASLRTLLSPGGEPAEPRKPPGTLGQCARQRRRAAWRPRKGPNSSVTPQPDPPLPTPSRRGQLGPAPRPRPVRKESHFRANGAEATPRGWHLTPGSRGLLRLLPDLGECRLADSQLPAGLREDGGVLRAARSPSLLSAEALFLFMLL